MVPIIIDISETLRSFSFSKEMAESFSTLLVSRIKDNYMQKWEKLVDDNLKQTKRAYKLGMKYFHPDNKSVVFMLEGKGESRLGLMIEAGASPFDQKEFFGKSSKRHQKKDGGWYLNVPYRIATTEALAESSVFSGQMTDTVQRIVRREGVITSQNMPTELQTRGTRAEIRTDQRTYPEYTHRSFQFEGLRRNDKPNHGGYIMFRRVSENSDENAWIHPGFTPRNFMEKALDEIRIDMIYKQTRDEFLSQII